MFSINWQHWTRNYYNGHSSCKKIKINPGTNTEVIYSEDIMQDCICGTDRFQQSFFDGGLFGKRHYTFSSALTLSSSSDSLLHGSRHRQHVCLTLTGHPQIQTLCKEPPLRVCECVCLWGCWSRMLIQRKGAVRDAGWRRKKTSPESRRTRVVRVCLLQREGRERNGLRNSEVVQESWAEPQCCVAKTERGTVHLKG